MKLLFVVNPISGGVDKEPFLNQAKSICEKYGIECHIFKTTGNEDKANLIKVLEDYNPDKVASVGGDGTTLLTAISLMGSQIPMGIIPLGSANGMATELSVAPNPIDALKDIIISQITGLLDLLEINDNFYSIHIGDVGINAQIVESYEKDENRGMSTYAKYFIEQLSKHESFNIEIETQDGIFKEVGIMAAICNSRKYGTGVPLNLNGNPMDGIFEIIIIKTSNPSSIIKAGLSKFNEKFHDANNTVCFPAEKATLRFNKPRLLQLDGEIIGEFPEIKVKILAGAIKLITNQDNQHLI